MTCDSSILILNLQRKFYDLKKGKAVLININKVKDEPEEREGSRVDMQKMKHLLMQMSCDVECYLDVCADVSEASLFQPLSCLSAIWRMVDWKWDQLQENRGDNDYGL